MKSSSFCDAGYQEQVSEGKKKITVLIMCASSPRQLVTGQVERALSCWGSAGHQEEFLLEKDC